MTVDFAKPPAFQEFHEILNKKIQVDREKVKNGTRKKTAEYAKGKFNG